MHTSWCHLVFHWLWKLLLKKIWFLGVLHACKLLFWLRDIKQPAAKECPSPVPQKSPEKMGTHNIFLLFLVFTLFWPALFKLWVSFSIRSKKYPSVSGFRWFFLLLSEPSAFRNHFRISKQSCSIFFSSVTVLLQTLTQLRTYLSREQNKPTENGIFCFYGLLVFNENF